MDAKNQTQLKKVVADYEQRIGGKWKPNERFFESMEIKKRRFGRLLRAESPMYAREAVSLAEFFGVSPAFLLETPTA